ncbi:hypothetical protein ACYULU_05845 [Breznakiellaceae bacterium SP9]
MNTRNCGTDVGRVIGASYGTLTNNYAALDKAITRGTPAGTIHDGDTTHNLATLQGSANQPKYTALSWNFAGDWKYLPGYNYPVLYRQTVAPNAELSGLGINFI